MLHDEIDPSPMPIRKKYRAISSAMPSMARNTKKRAFRIM